jgi:hypothetical protein
MLIKIAMSGVKPEIPPEEYMVVIKVLQKNNSYRFRITSYARRTR